jgi:hypothetical protein
MTGDAKNDAAMETNDEFVPWLRGRIEARTPVAVVRFGDGEAKLLTADAGDPESMKPAIRTLRRQTGQSFAPASVLEIQALVALALDQADVAGICFRRKAGRG